VPQKIENRITDYQEIPALGLYLKDVKSECRRDACLSMFITSTAHNDQGMEVT
jgi:hypothetical protein